MLDGIVSAFSGVAREAVIMLIFYVMQILMILADLWSGVRKAKRAGDYIASSKLRRTVDKVCKYYNMTLLLTLVDVVLIVSIQHYNEVAGATLPCFPLFTLLATLLVAGIEGKSIFEKLDRKTQVAAGEAASAVAYLAAHIDEADKMLDLARRIAGKGSAKETGGGGMEVDG